MGRIRIILASVAVLSAMDAMADGWNPEWGNIRTEWAEKVTPENVWQSYPRPRLKREAWMNLNGLWDYAVTPEGTPGTSVEYEGKILVPFAVESSLSGVKRSLFPEETLWYRRTFVLDEDWKGKSVILHFGAVDFGCRVWVNGREAGSHKGGSTPFSFDITGHLKRSGEQLIEVCVYDPTDTESNARGKQALEPKGIWYTPVSGIWQTVWMEAVEKTYIKDVRTEADIEDSSVALSFIIGNPSGKEAVSVEVLDGGKVVASAAGKAGEALTLKVPGAVLWSSESPRLYHFNATLTRSGKVLDKVSSYFALREVDIRKDTCGYGRICLNGEPVFQFGTLDQGWWPDGLLTPPSEEAMLWDMVELKKMGFNTVRKHIKVEPELYYYYADSLGLMVWQDMVSGFNTSKRSEEHVKPYAAEDWNAPETHSSQWQSELFGMIDHLRFYPSITTWVVFNEGWGQHNTAAIVRKVSEYDRSRIIDGVSGWTDRGVGDLYDIHNYPASSMVLSGNTGGRVSVLGEFGGYGWAIEGHLWNPDMRNWGYKNIDGAVSFIDSYGKVVYDLETLIAQGLGAAIYTQTTDVEGEVNGLVTYDRKVVKVPEHLLHAMHERLYRVEPAVAVELVPDAQDGNGHSASVSMDGAPSGMATLPLTVKKGSGAVAETEFEADRRYENLSLWLNASGKVKVWLNGYLVMDSELLQTRHYGQFNISDFSSYLLEGRNTLRVQMEDAVARTSFDFGLRAF